MTLFNFQDEISVNSTKASGEHRLLLPGKHGCCSFENIECGLVMTTLTNMVTFSTYRWHDRSLTLCTFVSFMFRFMWPNKLNG